MDIEKRRRKTRCSFFSVLLKFLIQTFCCAIIILAICAAFLIAYFVFADKETVDHLVKWSKADCGSKCPLIEISYGLDLQNSNLTVVKNSSSKADEMLKSDIANLKLENESKYSEENQTKIEKKIEASTDVASTEMVTTSQPGTTEIVVEEEETIEEIRVQENPKEKVSEIEKAK